MKFNSRLYFHFGVFTTVGGYHPFILNIVKPMYYGNYPAFKLTYGLINANNIRILLLAIRRDDPLNISVIYGVINVTVLRVTAANGAVDGDFDSFTYGKGHFRFSFRVLQLAISIRLMRPQRFL